MMNDGADAKSTVGSQAASGVGSARGSLPGGSRSSIGSNNGFRTRAVCLESLELSRFPMKDGVVK
eukprot:7297447-Alexandrium_andersonii.AAC.1